MPGTDAALALGMMHVLIAEDLVDRDYIARYTLGFDALARARGRVSAGARRGDLRHCAPTQVIALARDYGTTKPAAIRVNYGLQRHAGGGNAVRAIACLPALDRLVARSRGRRAAVLVGHLSRRRGGARAAGPDPRQAAHDQHERDRRRAA